MDFLIAIPGFIFIITAAVAFIFWRRAGQAEQRVAQLEAELAQAKLAAVRKEPVAVPEPKPEPEPEAEPAPKPKPDPEPKPRSRSRSRSKPKADDPVQRHAVAMIQQALEMTKYLGFEAVPDSSRPRVYRVGLDLKSERDRQAAKLLKAEPFACIEELELVGAGKRLVLLLDTQVEGPS